ncbi:hypothetical protein [Vibrio barjaei]|uniref:hypothetical protein n=1 Tax=Vibrio barjaei TaxID=1676683 RepID=UPI0022853104|nr:hypothetical protein [Vibrio barjaei]MCY9874509.1 hypothetical protein [Vibrio barjaei]
MSFLERKLNRKLFFYKYIYGIKTQPCTSCAGTGRYDSGRSPYCGACEGSGKEEYRGPKALKNIQTDKNLLEEIKNIEKDFLE